MTAILQQLNRLVRWLSYWWRRVTCKNPMAASLDARIISLSREATSIGGSDLGGLELNGYRYLLYLEVLDYARNIGLLLQQGFQSNTPMLLLRGLYEGLADMRNLANDEKTLQHMKLKYTSERLKMLTRARDGNQFLEALVDGSLNEDIARIQQEVDDLRNAGAVTKRIRQRFEDAGLTSEYEGEYAFFSEYVHRGLRILENQFIHERDGDWVFPPELERKWEAAITRPIVTTAEWILQDARKQLVDSGVLRD